MASILSELHYKGVNLFANKIRPLSTCSLKNFNNIHNTAKESQIKSVRYGVVVDPFKGQDGKLTVENFISRVIFPNGCGMESIKEIFLVLPMIIKPEGFLDYLICKFCFYDRNSYTDPLCLNCFGLKPSQLLHPVQLRVCNILIYWYSNHPDDLKNKYLASKIRDFVDNKITGTKFAAIKLRLADLASDVCENEFVERNKIQKTDKQLFVRTSKDVKSPESPNSALISTYIMCDTKYGELHNSSCTAKDIDLLITSADIEEAAPVTRIFNLNPKQMACELLMLDYNIYKCIKERDIVEYSLNRFRSEKFKVKTKSIQAFKEYCNYVSSWTISKIAAEDKVKVQMLIIKEQLYLAKALLSMGDHMSSLSIISAVNSYTSKNFRNQDSIPMKRKTLNMFRSMLDEVSKISESLYEEETSDLSSIKVPDVQALLRRFDNIIKVPSLIKDDGCVDTKTLNLIVDELNHFHSFGFAAQ